MSVFSRDLEGYALLLKEVGIYYRSKILTTRPFSRAKSKGKDAEGHLEHKPVLCSFFNKQEPQVVGNFSIAPFDLISANPMLKFVDRAAPGTHLS